jgi:hypothetical protein
MRQRILAVSGVALGLAGLLLTAGCGHHGDGGAPKTAPQAQAYGQQHAQDMARFMAQQRAQQGGPH